MKKVFGLLILSIAIAVFGLTSGCNSKSGGGGATTELDQAQKEELQRKQKQEMWEKTGKKDKPPQ
jgi:hypothetical protein